MIFTNAMNIKKPGYSLLEILIAMTLSAIVITAAVRSVGSIYFSQKKIHVTQSFGTETQFLMERFVQLVRNNTIDYDRFFIEVGPDVSTCASFDEDQTPDGISKTNNLTNRQELGYETIFSWDTNADDELDRNLGGIMPNGSDDPCAKAWDGDTEQSTLYLINSERTLRTALREDLVGGSTIEIQQELGADIDGDSVADVWSDNGIWDSGSGICEIQSGGVPYEILGDKNSQEFCLQAHDWTPISPDNIAIENLSFLPEPDQDPFLSFAVDEAQVHPNVSIFLETTLRNPEQFGMEEFEVPNISLQTTASSRVFGNIRK